MKKLFCTFLTIFLLTGCTHALGEQAIRFPDRAVMVYVPAGKFTMGSDDLRDATKPAHLVEIDAFWIDRTEVTDHQYWLCMQAGSCTAPSKVDPGDTTYTDYPITWVTWYQAQAYCAWVQARLPTEAEWEYAARGPAGSIYPWGNDWDDERLVVFRPEEEGWGLEPVGKYLNGASWCGALDMAGNVWEWVNDWAESYSDGPQTNPQGPPAGQYKVFRGGSVLAFPWDCRSDNRRANSPEYASNGIGFRCARSP